MGGGRYSFILQFCRRVVVVLGKRNYSAKCKFVCMIMTLKVVQFRKKACLLRADELT